MGDIPPMIVGALSWYHEAPSWLAACVASMAKVCAHVVAFDGPYGAYPSIDPRSRPDEVEAIIRTADGAGMGYSVHAPREKWWGGEVEKRSALYRTAARVAGWDGWVLVLDADEVLREAPSNLFQMLHGIEEEVAEFTFTDRWGGKAPIRRLFRGGCLDVVGAHYVVLRRGRYLSGDSARHDLEPALYMPEVIVEHRGSERSPDRVKAKAEYMAVAGPIESEALEQ